MCEKEKREGEGEERERRGRGEGEERIPAPEGPMIAVNSPVNIGKEYLG